MIKLDARSRLGIVLGILWSMSLLELAGFSFFGNPFFIFFAWFATGVTLGMEFTMLFIRINKKKFMNALQEAIDIEEELIGT